MNKINKEAIEDLKAIPLTNSKEWNTFGDRNKKLKGRRVWWTFQQKEFIIDYICPKTNRVWFTKSFNGWAKDTNAISEMYLVPIEK